METSVLAFLVWSGTAQYWHVALLATCYGLANTLDMPTRQSFVVEMASKEELPSAIALNSTMVSGARMVGPAVAGLLVDRYGVASAFSLNGVSFVAVTLALAAMWAEGPPGPAQGTTVREDILAGLRYAARLGSLFVGTIAEWSGVAAAYAAGGGVALACIAGPGLPWWRGRAAPAEGSAGETEGVQGSP